jgi:hypothetical protein
MGRNTNIFSVRSKGGRKTMILLNGFQASPARFFDEGNMNVVVCGWVELVASNWNRVMLFQTH